MDSVALHPLKIANEAAPLPPPAPRAMPRQDLRAFDRSQARILRPRAATMVARTVLLGGSTALTVWLAIEMHRVLAVGDFTPIEYVVLGLFVLNIAWVSFGSVSAVLGFLAGSRKPVKADTGPVVRTAILLPVYNEESATVLGHAVALLRGLEARGMRKEFHLFVLSDTNKPELWLAEQAQVEHARDTWGLEDRLFYRHRSVNLERKVGNLHDWVTRWGGAYPYMLVLDADSLMEADTVIELARRIEADPNIGILQTVPRLVGGRTPLARLQQFAARVYGPLLARGLATWFGNAGNFWGHNAVIRTEAFAASCGLPVLPGPKPFGGLILSHDFVEAALIRRAGYAVVMADDLGGSFEQPPPNLIELSSRDRRWCQGNLQHLGLIGTAGLHPVNRFHLLTGAVAYLASPVWLLFLLAGMSLALYARIVPPDYFPDGWSLFPTWPQIDAQRAIILFGICLAVLYVPKLLGLVGFVRSPAARGRRLAAVAGTLAETLISALIAPLLMLTQTTAVTQILTGRDSGWNAQSRDADRVPISMLWRFHRRHVAAGLILGVAAGAISWSLLAWMSPAIVGMMLAVPLGAFVGSAAAGSALARIGLLTTPEERDPPPIVGAAAATAAELAEVPSPESLPALLADRSAFRRHLAWLDAPTERRPGEPDPVLATAWLKLTDGVHPADLTPSEAQTILASKRLLQRLDSPRAIS